MISSTKSSWRTSGAPQGLILGQLVFDVFINDLKNGTDSNLGNFTDDGKLGRVADTTDSFAAIQRGWDSLEN